MDKLIIHIGMAKTGTTAVQSYMYANRLALLEQGINYPLSATYGTGHHPLAWSLLEWHEQTIDCWEKVLNELVLADSRINVISSPMCHNN